MQDYNKTSSYDYWSTYRSQKASRDISSNPADTFEMGVGSVVGDITKGVVKGALDAGSSITNLGISLTNLMSGYDLERVDFSESYGLRTNTIAGNMTSIMTQFFVPFGLLGKLGKGMRAFGAARTGKIGAGTAKTVGRILSPTNAKAVEKIKSLEATGQVSKAMLRKARFVNAAKLMPRGAAADFIAFDYNEMRFVDMAQHVPGVGKLFEGLAYDEDDSWFEARMKNAIDGAILGFVGDYLFSVYRSRKAYREVMDAGGKEEDAIVAGAKAALEYAEAVKIAQKAEVDEALAKADESPLTVSTDAGDDTLRAESSAAKDEYDKARADGKIVDENGDIYDRPTVDEDGVPAAPSAPTRPAFGEGVFPKVDPDTGQLSVELSAPVKKRVIDEAAKDIAGDVAEAIADSGRLSGRAIMDAVKKTAARTDLPTNPRALGPDGKPIELPKDLSRKAANLETRRAALADPDGALSLTRALEVEFGKQKWGETMNREQLEIDVLQGIEDFVNLPQSEVSQMAYKLANASEEELQDAIVTMQVQGAMSTEYMNEVSRVVKEMLQHEDTLDNKALNHLADLFEAFDAFQTGYTRKKSLFGLGLSLPAPQTKRLFRKAANEARDACGLKP